MTSLEPKAEAEDPSGLAWLPPTIFVLAMMQWLWNAGRVWPLSGYDGVGHAAYALIVLLDGRLPHPMEGWSTFHPPLYYGLLAALWAATSWIGPMAQLFAGRLLSILAMALAARVLFRLLVERGAGATVASVTLALALFLPATQLAATTLGNEALGVAFASLALPPILALQRDPADARQAIRAGLFVGLALATKFTGLFVVAAALTPFARRGLGSAAWRAAALGLLTASVVAGPVYLRNVWLTGSPVPMTRDAGVVAANEAPFVVRDRELWDYVGFPLEVLRFPSIAPRPATGDAPRREALNESLVHVWGSAYVSFWWDTYMRRIPIRGHGVREQSHWGRWLVGLGLLPTATLLLGFGLAARELRRGPRSDAPLVAMSALGLAFFVAFTVRNPAIVASKGSYLLPLFVPAGLFFARGVRALPRPARGVVVASAASAAVASAVVFTADLVFSPRPLPPRSALLEAQTLPRMGSAIEIFLPEDSPRPGPGRAYPGTPAPGGP